MQVIPSCSSPLLSSPSNNNNINNGTPPSNIKLLNTFFGCYVPCVLGILGVVIFLQLGVAIGQAGLIGTILLLLLATFVVLLTVLSLSAIATNGRIAGGGVYFMISRALGPEFGGSVGFLFWTANAVSITFYLIGFAREVTDGIGFSIINDYWDTVIIGSCALWGCFFVAYIGVAAFARLAFIIFAVLLSSIFLTLLALLTQPAGKTEHFTSISAETMSKNLYPHFTSDAVTHNDMDYRKVFVLIFPAVTGILAGANMSGDLKNPSYAIPVGTLGALASTHIIYWFMLFLIAARFSRELLQDTSHKMILQDISYHPIFLAMGLISSTVSSGLSAMVGGARVLQALAKDGIIPILSPFGKGSDSDQEPRRALFVTVLLAQCFFFVGNLDTVSAFISNLFLLSYTMANFSCFALRVTSSPNFRPTFRYFNKWTAFLGFIMCLALQLILNPLMGALSIIIMIFVFLYIHVLSPVTHWGDIAQAIIFHQVRKYLLRLDIRKSHVKFWKPQVLVLISKFSYKTIPLLEFVNNLKKGGLYIIGHALVGNFENNVLRQKDIAELMQNLIDRLNIKAFREVVITPNVRLGIQSMLLTSGLGGMQPNTLIVGFPTTPLPTPTLLEEEESISMKNFIQQISKNTDLHFPLSNPSSLPSSSSSSSSSSSLLHSQDEEKKKPLLQNIFYDNIGNEQRLQLPPEYHPMSVSWYDKILGRSEDVQVAQRIELYRVLHDILHNLDEVQQYTSTPPPTTTTNSNTVVTSSSSSDDASVISPCLQFIHLIQDAVLCHKNLLIVRNFERLPISVSLPIFTIDVWAPDFLGWQLNLSASDSSERVTDVQSLVLQLAYVLSMTPFWKTRAKIRVISVVCEESNVLNETNNLLLLLEAIRIPAEVVVLSLENTTDIHILAENMGKTDSLSMNNGIKKLMYNLSNIDKLHLFRHLLSKHTRNAAVVFIPFPKHLAPSDNNDMLNVMNIDDEDIATIFMKHLDVFSHDLPPLVLSLGVENVLTFE